MDDVIEVAEQDEVIPAPEGENSEPVAEDANSEVKEPSATEPETGEEKAKKNPIQPRIKELTDAKKAEREARIKAEKEAEYWRGVAEGGGRKSEPLSTAEPTRKPTLEQFNYDNEAFQDALVDWKVQERLQAHMYKSEAEKAQQEALVQVEQMKAKGSEKYPDFEEVAFSRDMEKLVSVDVGIAVRESDNAPDVAYYLGKHPEFAKSLSQMSPHKALVEIGKLSAKLAAEPAKKTVTDAPEPVTKIAGVPVKTATGLDALKKKAQESGLESDRIAYIVAKRAG